MSGMRASGIGGSEKHRASHRRRLVVEPLEDRRMLAKLLPILVDEGRTFQTQNPAAFFDGVLFNSPTANVADYFSQSSQGQFTWESAITGGPGVLGPLSIPGPRADYLSGDISAGEYELIIREESIAAADAAGFDFSAFDDNEDGTISIDELSILIILDNQGSGAVRQQDSVDVGSGEKEVTVVGRAASIGELTNFSTTVHELAHVLGTVDLYGVDPIPCLSEKLTLMSCTRGEDIYDLDPWHKELLGWKQWPTFDLATPGTRVLKDTGISPTDSGFILVDSRRPQNDKLYVELRPNGMSYDQPADIEEGVAVWYVRENPDGSLAKIRVAGGDQPANVSVGPGVDGMVNMANAYGEGNTWPDGFYTMRWPDWTLVDSVLEVDRQFDGARYEFSWGIQEDVFEQNDTFATAPFLGVADQSWGNLTLDTPTDKDYFRFTADGSGNLTVDLEFLHRLGDIDIELLNSAGTVVAVSRSATDNESISFPVNAGESFVIHVYSSWNLTHPEYRLTIDGPAIARDPFEPNGWVGDATVLARRDQSLSGLTIHSQTDTDYFSYTAPDDGLLTIDVLFSQSGGDLDLRLENSAGELLTQSTTGTDNEQVTWSITAGDTYTIQVYGYFGATNPGYTLVIDGPDIPLPDLRAFELSIDVGGDNQVLPGESIDVFFDYDNVQGNASVAGFDFDVGFYLSPDPNINPLVDRLLTFVNGIDMHTHAFFNDTISITLPEGGAAWSKGSRNYYIGMYVDDTFSVTELDETNNFKSKLFWLTYSAIDFDSNGAHDCMDLDALVEVIATGTDRSRYDLNDDSVVNRDDLDVWLTLGGAANSAVTSGNAFLPGDANLDGIVDALDFDRWNASRFTAIASWCSGDFNADGFVDVSDFNIWNSNQSRSSSGVLPGLASPSVLRDRESAEPVARKGFAPFRILDKTIERDRDKRGIDVRSLFAAADVSNDEAVDGRSNVLRLDVLKGKSKLDRTGMSSARAERRGLTTAAQRDRKDQGFKSREETDQATRAFAIDNLDFRTQVLSFDWRKLAFAKNWNGK